MKVNHKKNLVNFENKIANLFNSAKIKAPIHLHSNNKLSLIKIFKKIKKKKIKTFCFSGNNGGQIISYCKNTIIIKSNNSSLIQVVEIFLGQIFCGYLEKKIS